MAYTCYKVSFALLKKLKKKKGKKEEKEKGKEEEEIKKKTENTTIFLHFRFQIIKGIQSFGTTILTSIIYLNTQQE